MPAETFRSSLVIEVAWSEARKMAALAMSLRGQGGQVAVVRSSAAWPGRLITTPICIPTWANCGKGRWQGAARADRAVCHECHLLQQDRAGLCQQLRCLWQCDRSHL